MFGFSVFLNEDIEQETYQYMNEMVQNGFKGIFTSIHIPEDDNNKYLSGLQKLGTFSRENNIELVVDISGTALKKLGFDFNDLSPLKEMGLSGIRIDYGIPMETVAKASHVMGIALNASTISEDDLSILRKKNANFENMEAWHNYYPRPETGLGKKAFQKQNLWLKESGFKVMAFVPGDGKKRGPLNEGLPTLEKHRTAEPFVGALELLNDCFVDKVYIGDPGIKKRTKEQFGYYLSDSIILFHAHAGCQRLEAIPGHLNRIHTNRMDAARDVIRSEEARLLKVSPIEPGYTERRPIGTVTIDNERYGRYAGELQITKRNLPQDERVNVLGRILESERSLLKYCKAGRKFKIQWEEEEMDLGKLTTEKRNPQTMNLDKMTIQEMLQQMNQEDAKVAEAIKNALPQIEKAVEIIVAALKSGGRLIYMGAGTSGRLGVLDAAECVPTFGVSPDLVVGLIAGGERAVTQAVEGAEDSGELGKEDLENLKLTKNDVVVGIAASGRTPYVIGGLRYAKAIEAHTVTIACNNDAEISKYSQIPIEVDAGPEVLTGSTRLKAGTTQKLILNMLSTCSMVGIGKVYQNLMVDVQPTNEKLEERSKRIIMEATECSYEDAAKAFEASGNQVKLAIVMLLTGSDRKEAESRLKKSQGFIHQAVKK